MAADRRVPGAGMVERGTEAREIVAAMLAEIDSLYEDLDLYNDPVGSLAGWIEARWLRKEGGAG